MSLIPLRFAGPDALRFLQAQLATDLSSLQPGQWCWAALLSLKGRVLALAPLLHRPDGALDWLLPADLAESVEGHLRRYLLRSKLRIERAAESVSVVAGAGQAQGQVISEAANGTLRLAAVAPGLDLLLGDPVLGDPGLGDPGDSQAAAAWPLARIRAGLPWITAASSDHHLPQALGLLDSGAVSVRKGCYPGQEIVARTHFLGRNKRVRCLLQGDLPLPAIAAAVHAEDRVVGEVVEACSDGERYLALAIVEEAALEQPLRIDERPSWPLDFS